MKREEYFNELQKKVAASKMNVHKIDHYFKKSNTKDTEDNSNDKSDNKENVDDDLMIEELDVKTDDDSEPEEHTEVEESDPITKV